MNSRYKPLLRWLAWLLVATLALQLYFVLRIALMVVIYPQSTTFERSEIYRLSTDPKTSFHWRQSWVPYAQLSNHLKRAVIAAEDASFAEHDGIDLEALEKAWSKNAKAERVVYRSNTHKPPKIVGGSTITQQLAKNLFLSGERTLLRKGQELVLTFMLETMLSKRRILEIYLNNVEWGQGVFGAQAAAQHYYQKSASQLSSYEAARLAVMLPRPKYFETRPQSGYLAARADTIVARMGAVQLP